MFLLRRYARRPSPSMVVAVIALLLASGGVAYAAIPNSTTGVIDGCYAIRTGALRVIDTEANPTETCTTKERALTWNQQDSTYVLVANSLFGFQQVNCNAGDYATGGGGAAYGGLESLYPLTNDAPSSPGDTPNGYFASAVSATGVEVIVWVICVDITP